MDPPGSAPLVGVPPSCPNMRHGVNTCVTYHHADPTRPDTVTPARARPDPTCRGCSRISKGTPGGGRMWLYVGGLFFLRVGGFRFLRCVRVEVDLSILTGLQGAWVRDAVFGGMARCSRCDERKSVVEFRPRPVSRSARAGISCYCRDCESLMKRASRDQLRELVREIKSNTPCADCGLYFHFSAMDFEHTGDDKVADVSKLMATGGFRRALAEMEKCEVVCSNCHRVRTWKRLQEGGGRMIHPAMARVRPVVQVGAHQVMALFDVGDASGL